MSQMQARLCAMPFIRATGGDALRQRGRCVNGSILRVSSTAVCVL